MGNIKCARCDQKVEKMKSETIELVTYSLTVRVGQAGEAKEKRKKT